LTLYTVLRIKVEFRDFRLHLAVYRSLRYPGHK
jgi:hypothetical protein